MSFAIPGSAESAAEKAARFALIAGFHAAAIAVVATVAVRPPATDATLRLDVRVIEDRPPPPQADKPRAVPAPTRIPAPPVPAPVLAAAGATPAPASFSVPPQPSVEPVAAVPPVPAPPPLVPARFDAAYLHNPPPEYPFTSRRMREQGQVLLRVRVDAQGRAKTIQIHESSGHPRLDEAAAEAVRRWQFVPARRGDEAVEDVAIVPVVFRLDR